jgi:glutamate/aspartate transport system substrate-binding protein
MLDTRRPICAVMALFAVLCMSWSSPALAQLPPQSRLNSIIAQKVIRIAYRTDARPFSFANEAKEPLGYTVDICKGVVESIAEKYHLTDLKIEWIPVTVETRFSAITAGKADMECGSSTVTLGRMEQVDFSNLIFVESTGVLVKRASNIHSFSEMAGKRIAVIYGTTNERAIANGISRLKLNATLVSVESPDAGISLLEAGNVDGFAHDKLLLAGAQFKKPEALALLPDDLSIEQYAITLPQGDWALRLAVNTGLARIFRSGRGIEVFNRWFFGGQPSVLLDAVYALGSLAD